MEGRRCRLGKAGFQAFKGTQLLAGNFYWAILYTSQGCVGRCDSRIVRDETAIEVDHTKESPGLAPCARLGVVSYSFDFGLEEHTLVLQKLHLSEYITIP